MPFWPTVLMVGDNREIRLRGRLLLLGIFYGERHCELAPKTNGSSLSQEEKLSGILVRIMGTAIFQQTQRRFVEMNEAIKQSAEA